MLHHPDGSPVDERLVDEEIKTVLPLLERGAIEGAFPSRRGQTTAGGATPRRPVRPVLNQEQLDPSVGGSLERLLPPGRCTSVPAGLLPPAFDRLALLVDSPVLQDWCRKLQKLGRAGVSLGVSVPDESVPRFLGQKFFEFGPDLVRGDNDDARAVQTAYQRIQALGHGAKVLHRMHVYVPLQARLRKSALIVATQLLLEEVVDLLELPGAETEEVSLLPAHHQDDSPLPAPDEGHERGQVELTVHLDLVEDRLGQGKRPPHVVEAVRKDCEPMGTVALELVHHICPDPVEIGLESEPLVMRQVAAMCAVGLGAGVEERVEVGVCIRGRRNDTRVEVQVDADRATLLGLKGCEVSEVVPGDRPCHVSLATIAAGVENYSTRGSFSRSVSFNVLRGRKVSAVFNREGRVSDKNVRDVIIIGGGPAGYTAALYSARANLNPLLIESFSWGGQLMITSDVENYPGYPEGVLGPGMMQDFRTQAGRFGTEFITDDVTRVDFSERPFRVWVGEDEYRAQTVIIATGAVARQLGLESERKLQGAGVSYCAVCDAAFFKEKNVVVVGGGDSAMEEAVFLAKFADKVTVVHRREAFRASPIMVDRARANEKIEFVLDSVVEEILGTDGRATSVVVRNVKTEEVIELAADGVFVAIGHDPSTKLFKGQIDMDEAGYILTKGKTTETSVPGVFAAGDVQDHVYRQAVTAAGSGCQAALDAERLLAAQEGPSEESLVADEALATPTNW